MSNPSKVIDGLYISDYQTAKQLELLKQLNITHIINISGSKNQHPKEFIYLKIEQDDSFSDITKHFGQTNQFIHQALTSKKRKKIQPQPNNVLVHCQQGVSRSASLIIAYLIEHQHLTIDQALTFLKKKHPQAQPNYYFMMVIRRWARLISFGAQDTRDSTVSD